MFYDYIPKSSSSGKLYKGLTFDLRRRINEHNCGNSDFTKNNGSWRLVYYEEFIYGKDARIEEKFLKSGRGKDRIKYLLANMK
jgi:putative endonuclease